MWWDVKMARDQSGEMEGREKDDGRTGGRDGG